MPGEEDEDWGVKLRLGVKCRAIWPKGEPACGKLQAMEGESRRRSISPI